MVSAAVRFDRGSPTLVVSNQSRVEDAEVRRVLSAIQKQVDRDFFPLWGWRAKLVMGARRRKGAMHIILRDASEDEFAGYHMIDGVPEAEVFTRGTDGELLADWQATLSHEVLEMIADPGVNLYARGHLRYQGRRRIAFVAYEVCDPVQASLYRIGGVQVSDFVTPEWFEPERPPGSLKFSFRDSVMAPFELADGGYIDAYVGGRLITVWGNPQRQKERRYRKAIRAQ
jgi:hypothetical protein